MEFENVGIKRLTKKGSRPTQTLNLDVPNLSPGEGRVLESGEIAIHDPKAGLMVLRVDRVHVYIPKTKARNPLDTIVEDQGEDDEDEDSGQSEPAQAEAAVPESAESNDAEAAGDAPLIDPAALSDKPKKGELGQATGGTGYGVGKY